MDRQTETKARRGAEAVSKADDDALLTLVAAGLRFQAGEDRWRVSGNTLPHRQLLRDGGGSWNKLDQCWEFSGEDPTSRLAAALETQPAGDRTQQRRGRTRSRIIGAIAAGCANAC